MTALVQVRAEITRRGITPYRLAIDAKIHQRAAHQICDGTSIRVGWKSLDRVLAYLGLEIDNQQGETK